MPVRVQNGRGNNITIIITLVMRSHEWRHSERNNPYRHGHGTFFEDHLTCETDVITYYNIIPSLNIIIIIITHCVARLSRAYCTRHLRPIVSPRRVYIILGYSIFCGEVGPVRLNFFLIHFETDQEG